MAEENEFIRNLIISESSTSNIICIGAKRQRSGSQDFEWIDGSPFDYTNWNDGEPQIERLKESHVEMWTSDGKWSVWGDKKYAKLPLICQLNRSMPH